MLCTYAGGYGPLMRTCSALDMDDTVTVAMKGVAKLAASYKEGTGDGGWNIDAATLVAKRVHMQSPNNLVAPRDPNPSTGDKTTPRASPVTPICSAWFEGVPVCPLPKADEAMPHRLRQT